jgi:hypothetical protein
MTKAEKADEAKTEKADRPIEGGDLKNLLNQGYIPSCTFYNDLPPHWQVNIVQVGCKFIDDDGNNDDKGAHVNVPGGQNYTLTSTYRGCCRSYIAVSKAKAKNGEEWDFFNTATVEDGFCGGNLKIRLVPEAVFAKGTSTKAPPFKVVASFD